MNIFHLHKDPKICAEYHCDKHVVKMILETAQMLSTAINEHSMGIAQDRLYKPAYPKHPMTLWVGTNRNNFMYAHNLGKELLNQYTLRYGKVHKSKRIYDNIDESEYYEVIPDKKFTRPPLCMPDEYKCDDYVQAYRNYYIGDKKRFARYTSVDTPEFMC